MFTNFTFKSKFKVAFIWNVLGGTIAGYFIIWTLVLEENEKKSKNNFH